MLALPDELGVVELLLLVLGAALALTAAAVSLPMLVRSLPATPARTPVALSVAAALGGAVGLLPLTTWRVGHDISYNSRLDRAVVERIGAYENFVDASVFDRLAREIPEGDTYYIDASPSIREERGQDAFPTWGLTVLLPRRAVARPEDADWIVTWGIPPRSLGVRVRDVRVVGPARYGFPPAYLARVA